MRVIRTLMLSAVLALGVAAPAAAQTTSTTMPPVRSIPVTPAPTVTTAPPKTTSTTVKAASAPTQTAAAPTSATPGMASTGFAADLLVPFGLLLIGLGAALTGGARRVGRPRYNFL